MSENELVDAVQSFTEKLKGDTTISVDALPEADANFNGVTFWLHFYVESQKVARAATKLTLAYSLPPAPAMSDVMLLVAELVSSYTALTRCFLTLPRQRGAQLAKAVTSYLSSLKSSLLHFLELFVKAVKESRGYPEVCSVGVLLEECKQVCSLPNDNRQAVIAVVQVDHDLMIDTVDEITSELKNQLNLKRSGKQGVMSSDEGEDDLWTETEFNIVSHSLRLAKLARTATNTALKILKRDSGDSCGTVGREGPSGEVLMCPMATDSTLSAQEIALLDELASYSSQLSPQLDDLFAFIYPPVDTESLPPLVDKFVGILKKLLICLDSCSGPDHPERELIGNLRIQLDKTSEQLRTLLVSNEILGVAHLSIS